VPVLRVQRAPLVRLLRVKVPTQRLWLVKYILSSREDWLLKENE
jgi:hypothetical protein